MSDFLRSFLDPPRPSRPLLEWRQNVTPQPDAIQRAVVRAREAGAGSVILRPAPGLRVFPGAEWTPGARAFLLECRAQEVRAYFGDDLGRSGTACGAVTQARPDLHAHTLEFRVDDVSLAQLSSWKPALPDDALMILAAPLAPSGQPDFSRAISLLDASSARDVARLRDGAVTARVYSFGPGRGAYADLLHPDTGALFMQHVHETLRHDLGLDFSLLTGFWTRSATLAPGELAFPWSIVLPDAFAREHGYDLREWLPALIANTGDDAARLRQEFWGTVARLCNASFWNAMRAWTQTRKLELCGTFDGAEPLNGAIARQGDPVLVHRALDAPGVAAHALSAGAGSDKRGLNAKLAASVAMLQGQPRVIAEIGRDCGWGTTLAERTRVLHHLLRQGANEFLLGAGAASLSDNRWRNANNDTGHSDGAWPSETHQPYWEAWSSFADYAARCGFALSQGQSGANVGVLWPSRSAQAHYHPNGHRMTRWVEEDLYTTTRLLDDLHYEYLLLPEDDLCGATLDGARILCGQARVPLQMIVLPSVTALSWAAWRQLDAWVQSGGKIVCLGLLPRWSERGRDRELERAVEVRAKATISDIYESYAEFERAGGSSSTVGYPVSREEESGGRWCCYQPRLNADQDDAKLRSGKLLRESLPARVETQAPHLLVSSRVLETAATPPVTEDHEGEDELFASGGELFFLFHEGDDESTITRANLRLHPTRDGVYAPHELLPWTGELRALPVATPYPIDEGGGISLTLEFSPGEARLLWLRPPARAEAEAYIERATFHVESWNGSVASGYATESGLPRIAVRLPGGGLRRHSGEAVRLPSPMNLDGAWSCVRRGPNVAFLPEWEWARARGGLRVLMGDARHDAWQALPTRENGLLSVADEARLAELGAGSFRTIFNLTTPLESLWLPLDAPDAPNVVALNGQVLEAQACPFDDPLWRDAGWTWFNLSSAIEGENSLVCAVEPRAVLPGQTLRRGFVPGVARLLGDFDLQNDALAPAEKLSLEAGSWHARLPFYAGAIDYTQWANLPTSWNNCRVFLELSQMRDACTLFLNGRVCATRVAPPYRFDASKLILRGGPNEIRLRIWNTAQAALEGPARSPLPSGLLGPARLLAYPVVHPIAE